MANYGYGGNKEGNFGGTNNTFDKAPKETVAEIGKLPFADCPERNITKAVCKHLGIRMGVSEVDGRSRCYYFPYYNLECTQLIGYKKRDMSIPKEQKGHFTMIGAVPLGKVALFGQQAIKNLPKRKRINFVEGEWDAAAIYQAHINTAAKDFVKNPPHVVSITHGSSHADASIESNIAFVSTYLEYGLGFDNDEANDSERKKGVKKGKEATEDVANLLMSENTFQIEFSAGCKDSCDMLAKGNADALRRQFNAAAAKVESIQVVRMAEIAFDELMRPKAKGVYVTCFHILCEKMRGFRLGEVTLVTSFTGAGKSTFCGKLVTSFAEAGYKTGMVFLEEDGSETFKRLLADHIGVNYNEYNLDPLTATAKMLRRNNPELTPEQAYAEAKVVNFKAYQTFQNNDKFCFHKDFGAIASITSLLNEFRTMVHVHGCKYIILDHISIAVANANVKDERQALDILMAEVAAFAKKHNVHIIIVSHLNRKASDVFRSAKEDEAFWAKVRKEDLRGSSALEGVSFTIIAIEIEVMPDRTRGRCRLTILKNRPTGWLGECDIYRICPDTGAVIDASDEDKAYGMGFPEQEEVKIGKTASKVSDEEWESIAESYGVGVVDQTRESIPYHEKVDCRDAIVKLDNTDDEHFIYPFIPSTGELTLVESCGKTSLFVAGEIKETDEDFPQCYCEIHNFVKFDKTIEEVLADHPQSELLELIEASNETNELFSRTADRAYILGDYEALKPPF